MWMRIQLSIKNLQCLKKVLFKRMKSTPVPELLIVYSFFPFYDTHFIILFSVALPKSIPTESDESSNYTDLTPQLDKSSNSEENRKNELKDLIAKFGSRWIKIIKKQNIETNV